MEIQRCTRRRGADTAGRLPPWRRPLAPNERLYTREIWLDSRRSTSPAKMATTKAAANSCWPDAIPTFKTTWVTASISSLCLLFVAFFRTYLLLSAFRSLLTLTRLQIRSMRFRRASFRACTEINRWGGWLKKGSNWIEYEIVRFLAGRGLSEKRVPETCREK